MEFNKLQKIGGICAILEAFIYIFAFIIFGAVLVYPSADASLVEELKFLSNNYLILSALNLIVYVLFGFFLAILVLAVHHRLKQHSPILSQLAFIFGVIWVGLIIASGMIANIGLNIVIEMGIEEPEKARLIWSTVNIVVEGLGGGNEIVGGVWVLLISYIALKWQIFSKALNFLGIFIGIAGVLTIIPLEIFTEIFGISQIFWFIWIGSSMINTPLMAKN